MRNWCPYPICRWKLIASTLIGFFGGVLSASAHEGPPFPILMDQPAVGLLVSVWADPDIGEARFFVIVESTQGGPPDEAPEISMWTEPVSGRLERTTYRAEHQDLRNQMQFEAKPYFDQRDMWNIGFRITSSSGESHELKTQIESTPAGYGLWDLAIYLFPFLLLGALWVIAMAKRRRRRLQLNSEGEVTSGSSA